MKTLKELNEKAWYRLVKVLYVFLCLPLLLVLFLAYNDGKDYHPTVYPKTIVEALNDPEFYKVSDDAMELTILNIVKDDDDFRNWGNNTRHEFIKQIKKVDVVTYEWIDLVKETVKPAWIDVEIIENPFKRFITINRKTPFPPKQKYFYASYYTRNIGKTISNLLIAALCYVLFMEIIRRTFYYVVIGKLFPKE